MRSEDKLGTRLDFPNENRRAFLDILREISASIRDRVRTGWIQFSRPVMYMRENSAATKKLVPIRLVVVAKASEIVF